MVKITLEIDRMMCGMCEAHVNDAIRKAFPVKKVVSDHRKGTAVLWTEQEIGEQDLNAVLQEIGYEGKIRSKESYPKKGLFERRYGS